MSMRSHHEQGIVLPMALIMLVIISLAGLLAARNSATHEQFSNNTRTTQVARQSAEAALRFCESAVTNEDPAFNTIRTNIVATELEPDKIADGVWNTNSNWATGASNLITYKPAFDPHVQQAAQTRAGNHPTCLIQAMKNGRYLITARGLSNDAVVDRDNRLSQGSEIWLQSVLTPEIPNH
ncbi:pilus assembly PilX family protein [Hydrogenophaga sp. BPS33]|uniref:pilus assembly PilX family protein n=1 Tax=Hydrogenophaga sp. BPS33 TaxID=2651974 RepID=UPI00132009E6|nr:PilX N-terminal domain-containing pilus assembly protein [Hydrogenophaga sp. BPS33]QHE86831.1 hypothetical protein F9K07_18975 [Hydrogenophaga sp. BPS33]